jgi:hypothetical protein
LKYKYQFQYHELAKIRFRPVLSGPAAPVPTLVQTHLDASESAQNINAFKSETLLDGLASFKRSQMHL